jgi:dolichol-phosphate mannosyltransferase
LASAPLSVIVPTYQEVESIPVLIERLGALRQKLDQELELIIVDDDSRDGIVERVEQLALPWVRLLVRTQGRGLSQAVLAGLYAAKGDPLIVMDADLSHPPEAIPNMLHALEQGADFVVGSRYVEGGSTADGWGALRWANSKLATALAAPLTPIRDPMSGYFALPRSVFTRGSGFNPVGYKIGLELLVRCGCERVVEVPIHFSTRAFGVSKLTMKQQFLYLKHLSRLYPAAAQRRRARSGH